MPPAAPLSPGDRADLLALARAAVAHRLGQGPAPVAPAQGPLAASRAAFVSLGVAGQQRAAVGELAPTGPLAEAVIRLAARAAAGGDPRFPPLTAADLPALSVGLAVLGPVRRLASPAALRVGAEGVAVAHGWHRGVILPSAAGEGWDAARLLKQACLAAGLPARAHQEPDAVLEAFEAEEFAA